MSTILEITRNVLYLNMTQRGTTSEAQKNLWQIVFLCPHCYRIVRKEWNVLLLQDVEILNRCFDRQDSFLTPTASLKCPVYCLYRCHTFDQIHVTSIQKENWKQSKTFISKVPYLPNTLSGGLPMLLWTSHSVSKVYSTDDPVPGIDVQCNF